MYTTDPIVEVFTIAYNEEKIIKFFIEHYLKFCNKITIFNNYSTDSTSDIVKSYENNNVHLKFFDTNNSVDDKIYLDIKNNCWKSSEAEYVIIVDSDEFLYHPDIKSFLRETKQALYRPLGYNMVSDEFPSGDDLLVDIIKEGVLAHNYSKMCLFSPAEVSNINYSLGCHNAAPQGKHGNYLLPYISDDLKLLHYKNLSFNYRYSKHIEYSKRMSDFNKQTGSGIHYTFDKDQQYNEFLDIFNKRLQVI